MQGVDVHIIHWKYPKSLNYLFTETRPKKRTKGDKMLSQQETEFRYLCCNSVFLVLTISLKIVN